MTARYKTRVKKPCDCGANRWKTVGTVHAGFVSKFQCRRCGAIRNVTMKMVVEGE